MDHDIFADRAVWGNYPRLTCLVCDETVLKKPYMTAEQWEKVASDFKKKHEAAQLAGELIDIGDGCKAHPVILAAILPDDE